MKILADENVESEIVVALRAAGFEVIDIKEQSPGIDDYDVLSIAANADAVLLTNDKDFGELVFRDQLVSSGVVLMRLGTATPAEKIENLLLTLNEHGNELEGAFTVISLRGLRVRKNR